MIAEIISIGDELTSGQRLDTNAQWLSQRLGELGVRVVYHTTVADDLAANVAVFQTAIARADIVLATGGLGPTADDLTREALAQAIGVELVLDEPSLQHIQQLFARHKRPMPERNRLQAMFPAGSRPIFNPDGTAPGIHLEVPRAGGVCRVFALPGVPAEMFEMVRQTVAPAVAAVSGGLRLVHRRIKCFGVGESQLEQMLPDLIRRGREPAVGITVHEATITLRITAAGRSTEQCLAAMEPTVAIIRETLGSLVFGEEDDELEDVVVQLLRERGQTLASVEWGTRGLLGRWLCRADESGTCYRTGALLNMPSGLDGWLDAGSSDLSSAATAEALAERCRQRYATDYALAIGPFPEDAGSSAAAAEFFFALATPEKVMVHSSTLASHAAIWKPRAAKQALNLLRLALLERAPAR